MTTQYVRYPSLGAGTVTALTVATANGFAGSSSGGATPALTLSTTITGVLKGNGTAISAATVGTDYSVGTGSLATGILKSTTTTGALSIAVAGDFPTLNQNTSGTAAGLSSTLVVGSGGTGQTSLTANNVILGNGASGVLFVAPGTSGNVLTSNGTTWASASLAVIAAKAHFASGTSITADTNITFDTEDYDTNNALSAGVFTAPVTGYYMVNGTIQSSAVATNYYVAINGTLSDYVTSSLANAMAGFCITVFLTATNTIALRPDATGTISAFSRLCIQKVTGN